MDVVDDLLADIDGRAIVVERPFDRVHGALDAGAIAARRREKDALDHWQQVRQRAVWARRRPVGDRTSDELGELRGSRPAPSATKVATTGSSVIVIPT